MAVVEIPWSAWYRDAVHQLEFPPGCRVDVLIPQGGRSLTIRELRDGIDHPIDSPRIEELGRGCRSACIVIDDVARPTRTAEILPILTEKLAEAGLPADKVAIVIAVGSHRRLSPAEVGWKVGVELCDRHVVECHDCREGLTPTGIPYGQHELLVNQTFLAAELKIVVGCVLPHPFAGYSGGAKLVLPGLADLRSIRRSHQFVQMGLRGGADPNANQFRLEAEEISRKLGVAFAVCVVTGPDRGTIGVYCGDLVSAHRRACEQASTAFATDVERTYDAAVVNAYPKDIDLIQAESAFTGWKTARGPIVREGGLIVLACAATCGRGSHGLFEPGGASYHVPRPQRWLGGRDFWVYCPGATTSEVRQLYWEGYPVFHDRAALAAALSQRLPASATIAVFPCGPAQQVRDLRASFKAVV
jgi:nickel-dependent lactate racemase